MALKMAECVAMPANSNFSPEPGELGLSQGHGGWQLNLGF